MSWGPHMFRADKGTVVGTCQCIDCGNKVAWKVSANQLVYYQCLSLDDNYSPCKSYIRRSPAKSQKMIEAFHKNRMAGAACPNAPEVPEGTANDNHAPQPDPEPEKKPVEGKGGLFGG